MILQNYINQTITIIKPMELVPERYEGKLLTYYYSKFAQYENCLTLIIKRPRARKSTEVIILPSDTAYIVSGPYKSAWRTERVNENTSKLHRLTAADLDNIILTHNYKEPFKVSEDYERFYDLTSNYMEYNSIKPLAAPEVKSYLNYIVYLLREYNVNRLRKDIKENEYNMLLTCIDKALTSL